MGFEDIFKRNINTGMNTAEYTLVSKERPHISKDRLDRYSNAVYIRAGELQSVSYASDIDTRYIAATELTYDIMMSLHDLNSRRTIVYRAFQYAGRLNSDIKKEVTAMSARRPNIEARLIGLQNGQDFYLLVDEIASFLIKNGIKLVEVDLFGGNTRHIAIDTKLGMSLDILNENRLYRAGELVNTLTLENFEAALKQSGTPQKR